MAFSRASPCSDLVEDERFTDLPADSKDRIKGSHGFLKDHRNLISLMAASRFIFSNRFLN